MVWAITSSGSVNATELSAGGLSFSDELGGFQLLAVSGEGSLAKPFIVVERFTGPSAALVVRGLPSMVKAQSGSLPVVGFHIRKIITNATNRAWPLFELELREDRLKSSDYYDGLSFDQLKTTGRPFRADRFTISREINEPFDYLRFSGGGVAPGETVTIDVVVTDTSPRAIFYLLQQPKTPVAATSPTNIAQVEW